MRKPLSYVALALAVSCITWVAIDAQAASPSGTWYQCVNAAGQTESTRGGLTVPTCAHSGDRVSTWQVALATPPSTTTTARATSTTAAPTTTRPSSSTTAATVPATTTASSGDGLPGPIAGMTEVCAEDFSKPAATGSWATTDASKVVYTGTDGCKFTEYPDGWASTNTNGGVGYCPKQVLSVHDGVLDFNLAPVNGHACGANPSPLLPSSPYVTSGKFIVRMRTDKVAGYHDAFLLWPENDNDWQSAESDFPEMDLTDSTVSAYAHYGGSGSQDAFEGTKVDLTQYHTYEQDWSPGKRSYYVDGQLIGTSTHSVYAGPERYQLQTEPSSTAAGGSGHQLIDWLAVFVPSG